MRFDSRGTFRMRCQAVQLSAAITSRRTARVACTKPGTRRVGRFGRVECPVCSPPESNSGAWRSGGIAVSFRLGRLAAARNVQSAVFCQADELNASRRMKTARVRTPCSALEPVGSYHPDCLPTAWRFVRITVSDRFSERVVGQWGSDSSTLGLRYCLLIDAGSLVSEARK